MSDVEALFEHLPHPHVAARAEQGPVKVADQHRTAGWWSRLNARLAVGITAAVGTMTCAWLFTGLALVSLPAAVGSRSVLVMVAWLAQTLLQLTLLPVIMVGQTVANRASDKRAEQTYLDTEAILHELHEVHRHLDALSPVGAVGTDSCGLGVG